MDFLSNIFHGIGDFVGGLLNGNNDQRKRQQQQQQSLSAPAPQSSVQPGFHSALPGVVTQTTTQAPAVNLYQAPAANQLQKPAAPRPTPAQPQQPFAAPAQLTRPLPTVGQITGIQTPQALSTGPGFNPVNWVADNIVKPTADVAGKVANTGIGGIALAGNALSAGADQLFRGGKNANFYQNEANAINNNFLAPGKGLFGAGGFQTGKDFETESPAQALGAGIGAGAQVAPYLIGNPEGALIDKFGNVIGDKFVNAAASTLAKKGSQYAVQGALMAPAVAGANAVDQAVTTGKFNPGEAIQTGLASIPASFIGSAGGDALHALGTKIGTGRPETQVALPGEAAPGIASINPNRETDAISQMTPPAEQMAAAQVPPEVLQGGNQFRTTALDRNPPVQAPAPQQLALPEESRVVNRIPESLTKAPVKAPQDQLPAVSLGNNAKTGEMAKSSGKYSKGQQYEKTSREASQQRGSNLAANTDYQGFIDKVSKKDGMTSADRDTAVALQKRFQPGSVEHRSLGDLTNKYHTEAAQTLSTIEPSERRTADPKQLTDRFANNLYRHLDDNKSISDKQFESVQAKNEAFTAARDTKDKAIEDFNKNPSQANTNAVVQAFKDAESADRAARFEEYKVSSSALKGSKDPKAIKFVQDQEKGAGVYQMDAVDSSMLSSTRVMLNNFLNTVGSRTEESLFGKTGAALARKLTGADIGGGSRAGAKLGAKIGGEILSKDTALRQKADGNVFMKTIKNAATTGNSLGDRNMYAAAYSGIFDHYRSKLKKDGYTGDELKRRSLVNSLVDPDNEVEKYVRGSFATNAQSSLSGHEAKLESVIANKLAQKTGNNVASKTGAKLITRLTLGYPTVIARNFIQSGKRALFGVPSAGQAVFNAVRGGKPEVTAMHIKNSIKEFGTGTTTMALGYSLGQLGIVSGSYPTDKDLRAQWQREGKTENSINIGGSWYQIPQALGVLALPFMIGANAGSNAHDGKNPLDNLAPETVGTLIDSMPTSSLNDALGFLDNVKNNDSKAAEKYLATIGASATKALTPAGSLVSELAKMYDPTANDTSIGDGWSQFLAKVASGNPFTTNSVANKVVNGNEIKNPSPVETALGAVSTDQSAGKASTAKLQGQLDAQAKQLSDNGALSDDVRNVLPDDATKQLFDELKSGEKIQPSDMKTLTAAITKNVDGSKDTRFLEDGNYDANLAVLKTKRAQLANDPTTPKSTLDQYDTQITRGQIYKDQKVPYKLAQQYEKTSLAEWRNMGDPESDAYNPDLYKQLYSLDSAFTGAGVSRNSSDPSITKYSPKAPGKGRGGSRGGRGGATNASGGTISPVELKNISLGSLSPQKISNAPIPTIRQIKPTDLPKKRTISISKG